MAIQLQLRKGTKAENDSFVGVEAELTYDTTTKGIRVHDGVTVGGNIIDTVVFFQAPTAENNYTWVRKYASGWVEQGGIWTGSITAEANSDGFTTITLPIEMADTNYIVSFLNNGGTGTISVWEMWGVQQLTSTNFRVHMGAYSQARTISRLSWEVKGMAA